MTELLLAQYGGLTRGTTLSPPCAKVQMALRFKGLEFEIVNCKTPGDVKRFNSRGRLPALRIDGEVFVDSSDILTELDRRWPDPPLLPADAHERAQCRLLEDWADEAFYFQAVWLRWMVPENFDAMRQRLFSKLPFPLSKLLPRIALRQVRGRLRGQGTGLKPENVIRRELHESLEMLDTLATRDAFLCGAKLSRADLAVAATLDQFNTPLTPAASHIDYGPLPHLDAWLARVHDSVPGAAK